MDTITTTIKREWLAKIVDRSKRIEYREIKRSWTKRLRSLQLPFRLVLRNENEPAVSSGDGANCPDCAKVHRAREESRRATTLFTLVGCLK
jgi:hypothetical protein